MLTQFNTEKFRLRPSVSLVPLEKQGDYQFFLSDIRQSFNMRFTQDKYIQILKELNGEIEFSDISRQYNLAKHEIHGLENLFQLLINKCVIEDFTYTKERENSEFYRIKNFLANYVPYPNAENKWCKLSESHAFVIGVGGVGSWVVHLLAQMGVRNFTLMDDDIVKAHNLNRSLFTGSDIGTYKTQALATALAQRKKSYYNITSIHAKLENKHLILNNMPKDLKNTTLINCADYPSVSATSLIINDAALELDIPFLVAGGYNMHLSLIGPTIIPRKSPCFQCILTGMEQNHVPEIANARRLVKQHRNIGNIGPLTSMSASFVANEYLKVVLDLPNLPPTMLGKRGEFNFLTKKISYEAYEIDGKCSCNT